MSPNEHLAVDLLQILEPICGAQLTTLVPAARIGLHLIDEHHQPDWEAMDTVWPRLSGGELALINLAVDTWTGRDSFAGVMGRVDSTVSTQIIAAIKRAYDIEVTA